MSRCKHGMLLNTCSICSKTSVRVIYGVEDEDNILQESEKLKRKVKASNLHPRQLIKLYIQAYGQLDDNNIEHFLYIYKYVYGYKYHEDYHHLPKYIDEYVGKIGYGSLWVKKHDIDTRRGSYNTLSKMNLQD